MALNSYEYFNSTQMTVGAAFSTPLHLGAYQRGCDWGEPEVKAVIFGLFKVFEKEYVKKIANPKYRMRTVRLWRTIFAVETLTTDSFGNKTAIKKWLVDGQQRLRHLSLMMTAINKIYPTIQLGELIPVKYDNEGNPVPLVSSPSTDEYMLRIWGLAGLPDKYLGNNVNVRVLDENYNSIYSHIASLQWSEAQMRAFVEWIKTSVSFSCDETSLADAGNAFIDYNTNNPNLKEFQVIKALIAINITDDEKSADFERAFDNHIETLVNIYGVAKGKIDGVFTSIIRCLFGDKAGTVGNASFEDIKRAGQWLAENYKSLGLKSSEDFYKFGMQTLMVKLESFYMIRKAQTTFDKDMPNIYQTPALGGDYLDAVLLAPIEFDDSEEVKKKKLDTAASVAIVFVGLHELRNKSRKDGRFRKTTVDILNAIRNKSLEAMVANIEKLYDRKVAELEAEGYIQPEYIKENLSSNNTFSKFSLQSVDSFLSVIIGVNNQELIWHGSPTSNDLYPTVEHMISNNFHLKEETEFTKLELESYRGLLCMQGMLAMTHNSQIQDIALSKKLSIYSKSGIFLASICPDFYNENGEIVSTRLREFVKKNPQIIFPTLQDGVVDVDFIEKRNTLFKELMKLIFNISRVRETAGITVKTEKKTLVKA